MHRTRIVSIGGTSRFPQTPSTGPLRGRTLRVGPKKLTEPVALSSTASADFPLPGTALRSDFVLLALRARRKSHTNVPAEEVKGSKRDVCAICALFFFLRCTSDSCNVKGVQNKEPAPVGAGPKKFAEPVSLSSTASADLPLPGTAFGLGFDLLALRAPRKQQSNASHNRVKGSQKDVAAICAYFSFQHFHSQSSNVWTAVWIRKGSRCVPRKTMLQPRRRR